MNVFLKLVRTTSVSSWLSFHKLTVFSIPDTSRQEKDHYLLALHRIRLSEYQISSPNSALFTVVDDKAKLHVILYKTQLLSFSELTQEEKTEQSASKISFNKDIPDFNAY